MSDKRKGLYGNVNTGYGNSARGQKKDDKGTLHRFIICFNWRCRYNRRFSNDFKKALDDIKNDNGFFDYIKLGPYIEEKGGLDNPNYTTNDLFMFYYLGGYNHIDSSFATASSTISAANNDSIGGIGGGSGGGGGGAF